MNMNEKDAVTDFLLLKKSLCVLITVILGFVLAEHIGLENGFIALFGAALMLLLYTFNMPHNESNDKAHRAFSFLEMQHSIILRISKII